MSAGVRGCAVLEGARTRVIGEVLPYTSLEGWHRIDVWTGVVCLSGHCLAGACHVRVIVWWQQDCPRARRLATEICFPLV